MLLRLASHEDTETRKSVLVTGFPKMTSTVIRGERCVERLSARAPSSVHPPISLGH